MSTVAALANVARFTELVEAVLGRPVDLPAFGVFYGRAGLGKTCSAIYAANKYGAMTVRVDYSATPKGFLEQCALACGILTPRGTVQKLAHQVGDWLADNPRRPLIIDEADHLARRRTIEVVRDVYERCAPAGAAIILIGEEVLPGLLGQTERIASRVLKAVRAEPITVDDVEILASRICPATPLGEGAAQALQAAVKGSARLCVQRLYELAERAAVEGWHAIIASQIAGQEGGR